MKISQIVPLLFYFATPIPLSSATVCEGNLHNQLSDDCTEIVSKPLIVEYSTAEELAYSVLKKITKISDGLIIRHNNIQEFSFFHNLTEIVNENGPAILFEGNENLKRILFPALKILNGDEYDVIFRDDKFPKSAHGTIDGMNDLLRLKSASVRFADQCSESFFKVEFGEKEDNSFPFATVILIVLCVLILPFDAFVIYKIFAERRKRGESKKAENQKK